MNIASIHMKDHHTRSEKEPEMMAGKKLFSGKNKQYNKLITEKDSQLWTVPGASVKLIVTHSESPTPMVVPTDRLYSRGVLWWFSKEDVK